MHQSPFNVGTCLVLEDCTLDQVAEVNGRYDSPLSQPEVRHLYRLVDDYPYLLRRTLHEVAAHGSSLAELEE